MFFWKRDVLPGNDAEREKCYQDFLKYVGTETALFFSADINAAEMISFLHRNKVKIPEKISVAGMDDDVFATIVYPLSDYNPCRCRRKSGNCSECADETYTRGKV